MKVKCVRTNSGFLNENRVRLIKNYIQEEGSGLDIDIGCSYVVYGLIMRDDAPWYYILEDDDYPVPMPYDYFEVTDKEIPSDWQVTTRQSDNGEVITELLPAVWACNNMFYEKLLDEDDSVMLQFEVLKRQLSS